MNRSEAGRLALKTKHEDLISMLSRARAEIRDWKAPSHTNPSLSRGAMFNIFAPLRIDKNTHLLARTNMIAEFGEYLPGYEKQARKQRPKTAVHHQEPVVYPYPLAKGGADAHD